MTTSRRPPVRDLTALVLDYFVSFPEQARIVPLPALAATEVVLSGPLARRFDRVGARQPDGTRVIRLAHGDALAPATAGFEVVTPRSQLLRVIQAELAGRAAYARAVALTGLAGGFDDLAAYGVTVAHASPTTALRYSLARFFVVTFSLRLDGAEPVDDRLTVAVDAAGTLLTPGQTNQLLRMPLTDLTAAPKEYPADQLAPPQYAAVQAAIAAARGEAGRRAEAVARARADADRRGHARERDEVERRFRAEVQAAPNPARRADQERQQQQELERLSRKYAGRAELSVQGLQDVLVPRAGYDVLVDGAPVDHTFTLDPLADAVTSDLCTQCGDGAAERSWAYCRAGHHLECGACGTVSGCGVAGCTETACRTHAVRCAADGCGQVVCRLHAVRCAYCKTGERFCAGHIPDSAEGKPICARCRRTCPACPAPHPPAGVVDCLSCGRTVCRVHNRTCTGCNDNTCPDCRAAVVGHTGEYCLRCRRACPACGPERVYFRDDVVGCSECKVWTCPDPAHRLTCVGGCGRVLCSKPGCRVDTDGGPGCRACFAACRTCTPARPVRREQLVACHKCPSGDAGLHCTAARHADACKTCGSLVCVRHRRDLSKGGVGCADASCSGRCHQCQSVMVAAELGRCGGCKLEVCKTHLQPCSLTCKRSLCEGCRRVLFDGTIGCEEDARPCAGSGQWYPNDQLVSCAHSSCGKAVSALHSKPNPFGGGYYCEDHARTFFVTCPGCNRRGVAARLATCTGCGVVYCPACRPGTGRCRVCTRLAPADPPPAVLAEWADRVARTTRPAVVTDREWQRVADALAGGAAGYRFEAADGDQVEVLRAEYRGGALGFLSRPFRGLRRFALGWDRAAGRLTVVPNPPEE